MEYVVTFLLINGLYFAGVSEYNDLRLADNIKHAKPIDVFDKNRLFNEGVYVKGELRRIYGTEVTYEKYQVTYTKIN